MTGCVTFTRWRGYLADCLSLLLGYRWFSHEWFISGSALAEETRWAPGRQKHASQGAHCCAPNVVIVITPADVNKIAETIKGRPDNFDPVEWLEETWVDISIVATEAVKDVVWEGLAIGLADHPLVLRHQVRPTARSR
jgi:hypothetical protein